MVIHQSTVEYSDLMVKSRLFTSCRENYWYHLTIFMDDIQKIFVEKQTVSELLQQGRWVEGVLQQFTLFVLKLILGIGFNTAFSDGGRSEKTMS